MSMSAEFSANRITGYLATGEFLMQIDDYSLYLSEIDGGHRLTVVNNNTSETQTADIMNGLPGITDEQLAEIMNAESQRASAETRRASAENTRKNAEVVRNGAEQARIAAEELRAAAESNRNSAEALRASGFAEITQRVNNTEQQISEKSEQVDQALQEIYDHDRQYLYGSVDIASVSSGGVKAVTVEFDRPFVDAPLIITTIQGAISSSNTGSLSALVYSVSKTSFSMRVCSTHTTFKNFRVNWIAFGTPGDIPIEEG